MSPFFKERFRLIQELKEYIEAQYGQCCGEATPPKFAMEFMNYLEQFLAGNLNQILEEEQSGETIKEFFKFCRHLELKKHINRYSIISLFAQLFDACNLREGLAVAFEVLQDQIYRHGLILEDHEGNQLHDSSGAYCEYLRMIRLSKSIVKQLKNSGLSFEGEMKTSIKSLLARTIPLCHRSGLNLSGRFSGATGTSQARDTRRATSWIEHEEEQDEDNNMDHDTERRKREQTREYRIFQHFWRLQKYIAHPRRLFTGVELDIAKDLDETFRDGSIGESSSNGAQQNGQEGQRAQERREAQQRHSQPEVIEEGQADEIDIKDHTLIKRTVKQMLAHSGPAAAQQPAQASNLLYFLQLLEFFYNEFEALKEAQVRAGGSQESHSTKFIDHFTPLYLPKFPLFKEQMNAELPELFVLQSLITLDCLQSPIKDQVAAFKIDEQEKRYIKHMRERGEALLRNTMGQAGAVQVLQRDSLWSKSKNLINSKLARPADRLSHSQFDLTNFDQPIHQPHEVKAAFANKRKQKAQDKQEKRAVRQELLVPPNERQRVNPFTSAKKLFQPMRMEGEKKARHGPEKATNVKQGPLKRLNDYVNPILADQDPDNGIEDEYKHYHQQVFCWRFLRTVSYLDQSAFCQKKGNAGENKVKPFNGDVQELACYIHEQAKKREIRQERPEDEQEQDDEEMAAAQAPQGGNNGPGSAAGSVQAEGGAVNDTAKSPGQIPENSIRSAHLSLAKKGSSNEQNQPAAINGVGNEGRQLDSASASKIEEIRKDVQRQLEKKRDKGPDFEGE